MESLKVSNRHLSNDRSYIARILIFVALILLSLLFYVWTRVQVVRLGYQLDLATKEEERLVGEKRALELELSNLSSLQRIERIARDKLGLSEPRPDQVIVLRGQNP